MRRNIPEADAGFAGAVNDAFGALEFSGVGIDLWSVQAWRDLLLERGWCCPSWPDAGHARAQPWSAHRKFVWYHACHAHFDGYVEPPEIRDVGPCLLRWGNGASAAVLERIAHLEERWALGVFELGGVDIQTVLKGNPAQLSGEKSHVMYPARAQTFLVVARDQRPDAQPGYVLVAVPADAQGISIHEKAGLSASTAFGSVEFANVSGVTVLGRLPDVAALQALTYQVVGLDLGRSGALHKQLQLAADAVRDDSELESLNSRLAGLEIEVEALRVLEQRTVFADAQGTDRPVPWPLLQARGVKLQLAVGELLVDTFGYYALPFPDEISLHNEGSIGPDGSLTATRAMLRASEEVNYANLAGDLYDIAARSIGVV